MSPRMGVTPIARSWAAFDSDRVSANTWSPCATHRRAARRPTYPQPMINRESRIERGKQHGIESVLKKGDRHRPEGTFREETQSAPEPVPVFQQPAQRKS